METFIYAGANNYLSGKTLNRTSDVCPNCSSKDVKHDYTRGEMICRNCGLVMSKIIDHSPEWRAFSEDEKTSRSRVGSPISVLKTDFGVSSSISYGDKDIYGNKLNPNILSKMRRLRRLNRRESRSHIRNLRIALRELKRICSQLELSDEIAEIAATFYRKALKEDLIRGRSIESMVAAAIYLAARQSNIPVTLKDIENHINADRKVIARCFRLFVQELQIRPTPVNPVVLISKICDELELTMRTQNEAIKILEETKHLRLDVGKNPSSIAAASIYIAGIRTGERRTQQQVSKAAKTTPVTLRNRFREIVDALELANVIVKRGAASAPVYLKDPWKR
ncbi:MAG: transcription initiation factor IIB [Candidatus Heimdallarchaeaceae archaeon]